MTTTRDRILERVLEIGIGLPWEDHTSGNGYVAYCVIGESIFEFLFQDRDLTIFLDSNGDQGTGFSVCFETVDGPLSDLFSFIKTNLSAIHEKEILDALMQPVEAGT